MKRLAAAAMLLAAPAVPVSPSSPEVAQQWVNPAARPYEGTSAQVEITHAPAAISAHDPLRITLQVTNTSDDTLDGLAVELRRAPAVGTVAEQRVAAVAGVQEYGVVGERVNVDKQLPPGESAELELAVGAGVLNAVGTYPMMLLLTDASGITYDTDRFHLAVRGAQEEDEPAGLTALFPITAKVDIVPGETGEAPENPPLVLASEDLAGELAPNGRLSKLVDLYLEQSPEVGFASCMALDPALVDTVERMSSGYTVSDERTPVVEEPKRLRDSWGTPAEENVPGTGAADAQAWLAKVRKVSETGCTVALPWANADLNAVARTGDEWLMREAVERGPFVLDRVLGSPGTLNTVVTGTGYVLDGAAPSLGWADHSRSTIPAEGMQAAWERSLIDDSPAPTQESSLERAEFGDLAGTAAPAPALPVRVLAAGADGWLAPGVRAVGYQEALSAVLAATGEHPETTATSNPLLRFDYAQDSKAARDVSASAAVRLAAQSEEEVFINPPALWDADTAAVVLGAIADAMHNGVRPVPFEEYLAAERDPRAPEVDDPAAVSDAELLQVTQQATFINDLSALMVPDPGIALTRYGFTLPLRRDLLTALSVGERRALSLYDDAVAATSSRLAGSRDTLNDLRASVTLIPPGNVYTRTSPSSPLLIVAQNGMPLPVDAAIRYTGPEGARLNVPGTLKIPARGSVTVQMTADIESAADLQLYLANPAGQPISAPVDIAVRTSAMAVDGWVVAGLLGLAALLFLLLVRAGRRSPSTVNGERRD